MARLVNSVPLAIGLEPMAPQWLDRLLCIRVYRRSAPAHPAHAQHARRRCWCQQSGTGFRGCNRLSLPGCGIFGMGRSCQPGSPETSAHWDTQPPASGSAFHGPACGRAAASLTTLLPGRADTVSCGSFSCPCAQATRQSGGSRTGAAFRRSPASPCGSRHSPAGVHAGLSLDRHQPACRLCAARCHDPAPPGAPHLAA